MQTATLTLKRLELIRELLPSHATVGLLVNPDNSELLLEIERIARSTGQSLEIAKARNPDDLEPAFAHGLSGLELVQYSLAMTLGFLSSARKLSHWQSVIRFPRLMNFASFVQWAG